MSRAGLAIALFTAVLAALIFVQAARQFTHQLAGHDVTAAGDLETLFHSASVTVEGQDDHE